MGHCVPQGWAVEEGGQERLPQAWWGWAGGLGPSHLKAGPSCPGASMVGSKMARSGDGSYPSGTPSSQWPRWGKAEAAGGSRLCQETH